MSNPARFIRDYLTHEGVITGRSGFIERYGLPEYCAYTSGDGIFRNDSSLGRSYKFCRFSPNFNLNGRTSRSWDLTDEDRQMLQNDHATLIFPALGEEGYRGAGRTVYYIRFYGIGVQRRLHAIREDIRIAITSRPCVSCGTTTGVECDHKNDLVLEQNDERVLNTQTQREDDFQPLCKHCNCVKRAVKAKMMREGRRQGAPGFPARLAFWRGDETLDMTNLFWYIGTYWGDVAAFKERLFAMHEE